MRVEDLDLVRVLVAAGARGGDDEPAVGQAVQVRPGGDPDVRPVSSVRDRSAAALRPRRESAAA
ncbi:hypothetical protein AB0L39_35455, partial [Streptomyces parvus]|uniref:hypothetical protein n=1 Tax=Streptomyces parvus TaxID=66428 RepID=UPI0034377D3C